MLERLLILGADVKDEDNSHDTPLSIICRKAHCLTDLVPMQLLLTYGVNLNSNSEQSLNFIDACHDARTKNTCRHGNRSCYCIAWRCIPRISYYLLVMLLILFAIFEEVFWLSLNRIGHNTLGLKTSFYLLNMCLFYSII